MRPDLDQKIKQAHATGDCAALARFYKLGGEALIADENSQAGLFLLTHAYVFALEAGIEEAEPLHRTLVAAGREVIDLQQRFRTC